MFFEYPQHMFWLRNKIFVIEVAEVNKEFNKSDDSDEVSTLIAQDKQYF